MPRLPRALRPALLLPWLAAPALAQADLSALLAAQGLRGAEATLAALPDPTPSERFALGGVRLLAGVERALQLRYRVGLAGGVAEMSGLPLLRLPVPENPSPDPFEPAMIEELFAGALSDMAGALEALAPIADGDEVALRVDLADLWLDVDADGARGPGEGLAEVAATLLAPPGGMAFDDMGNPIPFEPGPPPVIRFDTADAAWLAGYAHLLSGVSEAVLAVGPTEAVARVTASREAFAALGLPPPDPYGFGPSSFADAVDALAVALWALDGVPDAARTQALRAHLLSMVEQSRRFWTLVARETDNDAEWIPNKRQVSATGLPFPPDTGPAWLDVLDDAEGVLTGELLIPYWRVAPGVGLDLAALLESPPDLDAVGLIQGASLAPYLRPGKIADGEALLRFSAMVRGQAVLYAVVLN